MIIGIKPIPASLGQASGDVIYYNGSAWARLPKGSDGQVLKLAAGVPSWAADSDTIYNDANVFYKDGSRNLTGVLVTSGQGIRPAANSTTAIQFQQAAGTALVMCDTTNKRQGIGIVAPTTPLTVADTVSTSPRGILSMQFSGDTNGACIGLAKARGTAASPVIITSGDTLGRLAFYGHDGSNYLEMGAIDVINEGSVASTKISTAMIFSTGSTATPSVLTERFRVTKDGRFGFNTSAPAAQVEFKASSNLPVIFNATGGVPGFELFASDVRKWSFACRTADSDKLYIAYGASSTSGSDIAAASKFTISSAGKIGLLTNSPTNDLNFGGNSDRTIWLERHTTAATPGNDLSIYAGGPKAGETNQPGGTLNLYGGICTGDKEGGVKIYGYVAGASGSADCSPSVILQVLGDKFAIFGGTAVVQQSHIADASGGSVVDVEARAAVNAVLAALENYGWLKAS